MSLQILEKAISTYDFYYRPLCFDLYTEALKDYVLFIIGYSIKS